MLDFYTPPEPGIGGVVSKQQLKNRKHWTPVTNLLYLFSSWAILIPLMKTLFRFSIVHVF